MKKRVGSVQMLFRCPIDLTRSFEQRVGDLGSNNSELLRELMGLVVEDDAVFRKAKKRVDAIRKAKESA